MRTVGEHRRRREVRFVPARRWRARARHRGCARATTRAPCVLVAASRYSTPSSNFIARRPCALPVAVSDVRADGARRRLVGGRQRDLHRLARRERAHAAIGLEGDVHELAAPASARRRRSWWRAQWRRCRRAWRAAACGRPRRIRGSCLWPTSICNSAHGAAAGDARVAAQLDQVGLVAIRIQLARWLSFASMS